MYCNRCGKENPDAAKFCIGCGNRLDLQKPQAKVSPAKEPMQREPQPRQYEEFNQQKKKGSGKGIAIVLAVLIIAVVIAGAFLWQAKFKTVDISMDKYIKRGDITFEGYECQGTAKINEKAIKKRIRDDYSKGFFAKMQADRVNIAVDNLELEIAPDWALENGDKISVECELDDNVADKTKVSFTDSNKSYTVKGLEEEEVVEEEEEPEEELEELQDAKDDDGYILVNSGTELLTEADLEGLSADDLALARNEIYARHGYIFKESPFKEYFNEKDWYKPSINDQGTVWNRFSDIEKKNVDFIKSHE